MPSADARVVEGRLDPHALQNSVGEGARRPVGRVGHQQVVAGRDGRHQRHDDRRKARRDELGPRRAGNVGPGRRERVRRRRAVRPIGVALGAALQRRRVGIEHGRAAKRRHIDEPLRLAAVTPEMDEARAALEGNASFVGEFGHEGRWVSKVCVRPLLARLHPRLHPAWRASGPAAARQSGEAALPVVTRSRSAWRRCEPSPLRKLCLLAGGSANGSKMRPERSFVAADHKTQTQTTRSYPPLPTGELTDDGKHRFRGRLRPTALSSVGMATGR